MQNFLYLFNKTFIGKTKLYPRRSMCPLCLNKQMELVVCAIILALLSISIIP